MDAKRIAEIRERWSKTQGWTFSVADSGGSLTGDDGGNSLTVDGAVVATRSGTWTVSDPVATARQDIPDLLAALEAAQKELEQLRAIFEHDMLEDDAGIRAAYERGVKDGQKQSGGFDAWRTSVGKALTEHIMQGFGIPTSPPPSVDEAWSTPSSITLNAAPLLLYPSREATE
jgi:hypothetical protein